MHDFDSTFGWTDVNQVGGAGFNSLTVSVTTLCYSKKMLIRVQNVCCHDWATVRKVGLESEHKFHLRPLRYPDWSKWSDDFNPPRLERACTHSPGSDLRFRAANKQVALPIPAPPSTKFRIKIITLILSYTVVVFRREPKANVREALALARALTNAPSGLPRYKKINCRCKKCEMLKLTNNLNGIISFETD